ncbi:energy transducer TonB [Ramlibacter terrae]|uniref:Energy transducer TonB n=1 Tax=Ramlibacter terrae TaxID=2732511 RepID=A0ABX6P233_9BURK|nr:energy transducer TonB [Ramlibacter terrae]
MLKPFVPEYPASALRHEEEGTVQVQARVLASGEVGEARVARSSNSPALDRAAVAAVRRSTFSAARNAAGEPVEAWVTVPFKFVLQD